MPSSAGSASVPAVNRLLAALPPREYRRYRAHLESVSLVAKAILHEPGRPVAYVYFPVSCLISLLSPVQTEAGGIEVAMVGQEGLVGMPAFFGVATMNLRSIVQVSGEALRAGAKFVHGLSGRGSTFSGVLLRYAHVRLIQLAQSVACSSLHPVEKRLCRWLLSAHDRTGSAPLPFSHAFLASMLGVRRASVTEAARRLRRAGLIRYGRGHLTVLDRQGLEAVSCDCYRLVQAEWVRVFG